MKFLVHILGLACLCYGIIAAALYIFQEKMLFFPMGPAFGKCPAMDRAGAESLEGRGVRYYLRRSADPAQWVVVFHGNAGGACDRTYFFDLFSGTRSHVVICEYPGYGGDNGRPGEKPILDAALALVTGIRTGPDGDLPIFLAGESLGTGVATWTATQTPAAGLILISAYTAIAKVAQHHYPWLPARRLLRHKFPADTWARNCTAPALLFHGDRDDIIPIEFARQQVTRFKGRARLMEIPGAGHNDIVDLGQDRIKAEIRRFLAGQG